MPINESLFSSKTNEWATPPVLFHALNDKFNFTLDPCATSENAKCSLFFTEKEDGLFQDWGGHRVFCNPPYGRQISKWVEKSYNEVYNGMAELVVMLIPSRTDTRYFHKWIYPVMRQNIDNVLFLQGRLKFGDAKNSAPFPSMIIIFQKGK